MTFNSYIDYKIKESLRILRFVHGITLGVLTILGSVIFMLVFNSGNTGSGDYGPSLMLLLLYSGAMILISIFGTNYLIRRINRKRSSEVVLKYYRALYIAKYVSLVLPILLNFLGYLYYSNIQFFMLSVFLALVMVAHSPTKKKINKVIKA